MADLLPSTPDISAPEEADPRVVGVDSDDADELLSALSSATARDLIAALHEDPANPAALADRVDTSLQNAQYHLSNLEDAGLIEVVDTAYSEKGREMNVYAPTDRPLVVYAGKEEETSGLRAALSRLLGAVGALALGSVVVEALFTGPLGTLFGGDGAGGGTAGTDQPQGAASEAGNTTTGTPAADATPDVAGATATETAQPTATEQTGTVARDATPTETAEYVGRTAAENATATPTGGPVEMAAGLPPGLLFFLGGLLVLSVLVVWQRRR